MLLRSHIENVPLVYFALNVYENIFKICTGGQIQYDYMFFCCFFQFARLIKDLKIGKESSAQPSCSQPKTSQSASKSSSGQPGAMLGPSPPSLEVHDEAESCLRDETAREAAVAEKIEEEIGGMEVGEREGEESMEQNESDEDSGPDIN